MTLRRFAKSLVWVVCVSLAVTLTLPSTGHAKTAQEIDASVNAVLERFTTQVKNASQFLQNAKGVLRFG